MPDVIRPSRVELFSVDNDNRKFTSYFRIIDSPRRYSGTQYFVEQLERRISSIVSSTDRASRRITASETIVPTLLESFHRFHIGATTFLRT